MKICKFDNQDLDDIMEALKLASTMTDALGEKLRWQVLIAHIKHSKKLDIKT